MNQRQVIVLWAVALVLVALVVIVKSARSDVYSAGTERERGEELLADFDPREVAKLEIDDGENQVTLEKTDDGWVVDNRDDYTAKTSEINELLRTVAEVEVTQGIQAEPEFAPRFGMDPEADDTAERGTVLRLADDADTELAQLTFGKNVEAASDPGNPFGGGSTGRFVRNHADNSGVYVTGELFPNLRADPAEWLQEDFLQIEKIREIRNSEPGAPQSTAWVLTREDEAADFTLEDKKPNENLDSSAINPLKSLFSYARFEDLVPADEAGELWRSDQVRRATIKTFEGLTYTIGYGPATEGEDYLMTVAIDGKVPEERKQGENETEEQAAELDDAFQARKQALEEAIAGASKLEGHTYRVSKFTVDALLKDRTDLIQSAPPGGGAPSASTPPRGGTPGPVRAVTPPIALPSPPAEEEPRESSETEEDDAEPQDGAEAGASIGEEEETPAPAGEETEEP